MDERDITCCFTGHRPGRLPWGARETDVRCLALKAELAQRLEGIYEAGYRRFFCGMALGCDTYFAQAVLTLKEERPGVILEAAVPCASQADKWTRAQQLRYSALLNDCDKVHILQQNYTADCMFRRNRYMVDRSSLLLAVFDGRPSGTMNTLVYAQRQGIKSIIIEL